jgi:methylthioribulose 1-phosphate dehydratase / enolase-phosphatase E1
MLHTLAGSLFALHAPVLDLQIGQDDKSLAPHVEDIVSACVTSALNLMDVDAKVPELKNLQGLIWHNAYVRGDIRAELFRDVPDALQQWRDAGLKTYIYSSGSRLAQRDLFGHTTVCSLAAA